MFKAIIDNRAWKNAEKLAAFFAVLLALPAFILSWLSYSTSQTAIELAKEDFDASRSLVLVGEVIRERDVLRISPQLAEMRLQSATCLFPPTLQLQDRNPFDSSFEIPLSPLKEALAAYAASLPKPDPESALVAPGRLLPFIVEAHYLAKGRLMFGRYLCNVTFSFVIRGDDKLPKVQIDGLVFVGSIADAKSPSLDHRLEDSFRSLRP